jgi:hypothetical protein
VEISVEVKYAGAFVGDKAVRDHFTQELTLSGSGETRAVTMGPFTIKREAEISVKFQSGGFTVSTGAMNLPGVVDISFQGVRQRSEVTLTTENASSPYGRYAANGSRLDSNTLAMVLVGGGAIDVNLLGMDLTYEYFVTATYVLAARPEPTR